MKYIYFQRIRLLKNKIAAELRLLVKDLNWMYGMWIIAHLCLI